MNIYIRIYYILCIQKQKYFTVFKNKRKPYGWQVKKKPDKRERQRQNETKKKMKQKEMKKKQSIIIIILYYYRIVFKFQFNETYVEINKINRFPL